MKNRFFILLVLLSSMGFSQGRKIVLGSNNGSPEYLLGSLPYHTSSNFYKLKVEVFGGNWHNNNLGENHYYISSRDGIKVHQELHGGSYSRYSLKVYDDGTKYDFVLKINGDWPSIHVVARLVNGSGPLVENDITDYDSIGKMDITSQITINTVTAVDQYGNTGLGVEPSSGYKLAVKGKIRAEEIKVETGWADYVFKEGYDLPTLEEVENHIKEKGHLINIPSAEKVEENGIQLGEMNKLLLEKIEELTLYTLQQEKKLKQQKKDIESLQFQIKKMEYLESQINLLQKK